jgi:hypothetical protein
MNEQIKQFPGNGNRSEGGLRIDPGNLTRWLIQAQLRFDPFDFVQRRLTGGAKCGEIVSVQEQFESGRHRATRYPDSGGSRIHYAVSRRGE